MMNNRAPARRRKSAAVRRRKAKRRYAVQSKVFAESNLLVKILGNLTNAKLFCVQRVSKTWRDAIASSTNLQRKLYLTKTRYSGVMTLNPLLSDLFMPRMFFMIVASGSRAGDFTILPSCRGNVGSRRYLRRMAKLFDRDPDGSWRNTRLVNSGDDLAIVLEFDSLFHEEDGYYDAILHGNVTMDQFADVFSSVVEQRARHLRNGRLS